MGILQRQTIKSTIYIYAGVLIGFVTSALLYPKFLTESQIGVIGLLVSWSSIFAQLATLGFSGATIKFFPYFRNKEKQHQGFLFLMLLVMMAGFGLFLLIFYLIKPWMIEDAGEESLLVEYINLLIPFTLFSLVFTLLDIYNRALYNASTGSLLNETVARLFVLFLVGLFIWDVYQFEGYVTWYVLSRGVLVLLLLAFLFWKGELSLRPDFSLLTKERSKGMLSLSLFSLITGFGNLAIIRIDSIMINSFYSDAEVGIYLTTFYFGTLVLLPSRALRGIAPTMVADAFKNNNLGVVNRIYTKSTITQLVVGCFFFLGIWANIDNVFEILPESFEAGKYVILFVGLMNILRMVGGINDVIIGYSQYYKVNTYIMLGWLALIILTNWWLLPLMGISGAALASLISVLVVNLIRFGFLYIRFGFQPYNKGHLIILFISAATYLVVFWIPAISTYILDILMRGVLITIIFTTSIYYSKTDMDINKLIDDKLKSIRDFLS
ncbi:O-antigen/teichoic acid export membrane protein [Catalinimonas alkaloidigena]|uniref:oligosaccharide flippase family protein n=1 Tax=Catalinimonas alkaloidigena TaxID=1075417 RepID=UPI0024070552|nr:oligosaccharide flippase family protein [Catalinimonas alkaloidigena]MDF9798023.1 O-antigen/teichoic acid export membrane protein [Catalinimonas alkaloidigena]